MKPWVFMMMSLWLVACVAPRRESMHSAELHGTAQNVVLDFRFGFDGDNVVLQSREQTLFSGTLTTDPRIGCARRIQFESKDGANLRLEVRVNRGGKSVKTIDLRHGRYLALSRNLDTHALQWEQREEPFRYD